MTLIRKAKRPVIGTAAAFACCFLFGISASAQESLADLDSFRDGCRALEDGRYGTATESFLATWSRLQENQSGDLERDFVASRLLESFVRDQQTAAAAEWLNAQPFFNPSPETLRWTAITFHSEQNFAAAAQAYNDLTASLPNLDRGLTINHAICLTLSQKEEAAFELIKGIETPGSPRESLQFAQIASRAGNLEEALGFLSAFEPTETTLPEGDETPRELRFAATALRAWIERELGRTGVDVSRVLSLIESSPTEAEALRALLLLEEVTEGRYSETLKSSFARWQEEKTHPASSTAEFFTVLGITDETQRKRLLNRWIQDHPDTATAMEARIRLSRLGTDQDFPVEKSTPDDSTFPGGIDRVFFENAVSEYRKGAFDEAATRFLSASELRGGEARSRNLYNGALALLQKDDYEEFLKLFEQLKKESPGSSFLADLNYIAGLYLASKGNPESTEFLEPFVRENPNHPALVEAQLALAEIHLNQAPARPQAAQSIFDGLRSRPLTLEQSERLDYTAVWLEVIKRDDNALTSSATDFLKNWPASGYLPEIAMLLGLQHYQNNRHDSARAIFDRIAKQAPGSFFEENARFFAAKATTDGPDAIVRWREIASSESDLALQARHELALLLLSLDHFREARSEFSAVVKGAPESSSLRFAALSDIAFSHYAEALANNRDPAALELAAEGFARVSSNPEAPEAFRYDAAVRRGKCLENLGNDSVALEIYDSMVNKTESASLSPINESDLRSTEWIFRAGFSAIDIMRKKKDWIGAIKMADALSRKDGPRAIEASRLSEQMRLRHWVWE